MYISAYRITIGHPCEGKDESHLCGGCFHDTRFVLVIHYQGNWTYSSKDIEVHMMKGNT